MKLRHFDLCITFLQQQVGLYFAQSMCEDQDGLVFVYFMHHVHNSVFNPHEYKEFKSGGSLREGMKVEARYRGKSRYYSGRLARDRGGGKWDIDYDDGDKERTVKEERAILVRRIERIAVVSIGDEGVLSL